MISYQTSDRTHGIPGCVGVCIHRTLGAVFVFLCPCVHIAHDLAHDLAHELHVVLRAGSANVCPGKKNRGTEEACREEAAGM